MKRNKTKDKPLVILTAGGTGGHVYPAEALAEELSSRGYRLALVTDRRGKDNYKGRLGEIPNFAVMAGGVVGKSPLFKIKSLFKVCIGICQAMRIVLRLKPECVVGFGGYASFPCSMAAILTGTNLVIHEQNSVMSRTNRFLSKYAALIAQSFRKVKFTPAHVKTILTGMPVRAAIAEVADIPFPPLGENDKMQLLVLGGSQGAKVFSEVVPEAIRSLNAEQQSKLRIFQQCRQDDVDVLKKTYEGIGSEVTISHFFDNMSELYAGTHLIISRAGASSVSEIAVAGVPSVLVPLPIAADDHQTGNADLIGDAKAGIVILQKDFTPEKLSRLILDLMNDYECLQIMSNNAKKAGIRDAASRFANAVETLIKK